MLSPSEKPSVSMAGNQNSYDPGNKATTAQFSTNATPWADITVPELAT